MKRKKTTTGNYIRGKTPFQRYFSHNYLLRKYNADNRIAPTAFPNRKTN